MYSLLIVADNCSTVLQYLLL